MTAVSGKGRPSRGVEEREGGTGGGSETTSRPPELREAGPATESSGGARRRRGFRNRNRPGPRRRMREAARTCSVRAGASAPGSFREGAARKSTFRVFGGPAGAVALREVPAPAFRFQIPIWSPLGASGSVSHLPSAPGLLPCPVFPLFSSPQCLRHTNPHYGLGMLHKVLTDG